MNQKYLVRTGTYASVARAAFLAQGFPEHDTEGMVEYLVEARRAGNTSHDLRKMLHLRDLFGDLAGKPTGVRRIIDDGPVIKRWDCDGALGPKVIFDALNTAMRAADQFGIGIVTGLNFSHYGCGFPYAYRAVKAGYVIKLWSTASLAEVVPYGGKRAATGTNAWTMGIPVEDGRHFVLDMATASMARGAVQALEHRARQGEQVSLPPDSALDKDGNVTTDPLQVVALLPFGRHKGGGLSLFSELFMALAGGGRPSVRCQPDHASVVDGERLSTTFVLQVVSPKHLWCGSEDHNHAGPNVRAVADDIFCNGNESCLMPGQPEQTALANSAKHGGLIFEHADLVFLLEEAGRHQVKNHLSGADYSMDNIATVISA